MSPAIAFANRDNVAIVDTKLFRKGGCSDSTSPHFLHADNLLGSKLAASLTLTAGVSTSRYCICLIFLSGSHQKMCGVDALFVVTCVPNMQALIKRTVCNLERESVSTDKLSPPN